MNVSTRPAATLPAEGKRVPPVASAVASAPDRWPPDQGVLVRRQSRDLIAVLIAGFVLLTAVGAFASFQLGRIESRLERIEGALSR